MKRSIPLFLLLGLGLFQCQNYSQSWKDVNYAGDDLPAHNLDIYLPKDSQDKHPAVMIIYGSAFFGDDMKQKAFDVLGKPLLNSGFAVVAINHRSSRDVIFPAQVHDLKAALRFIRARAEDYQIDTTFIAISGYSSGGYLSAMAGTTGSVHEKTLGERSVHLEGSLGDYLSYNSAVHAVVDWFGPIEFQSMDSCGSTMVHNASDSPESIFIGGPIQENEKLCTLANPMSYVDADDPPFLIIHGDKDPLVPHCQSAMLYDALRRAGVSAEYLLIPEGRHGPGVFEKEYFRKMSDFLREEYKKVELN